MTPGYDPSSDSTQAYRKQAHESGRLVLDISDSACLCGCKEPTQGRFRPGHDARLKGKLLRAHLNRVGVTIVKDGQERQMTARAFAKEVSSDAHDWTKALDSAYERTKDAQAKLRAKAESAKVAVKDTPESGGDTSDGELVEEGVAAR